MANLEDTARPAALAEYWTEQIPMDHVQQRGEPRDLYDREDRPLGPPSKPAPGLFLLGALVLGLDFWLLCVLAVRWLT